MDGQAEPVDGATIAEVRAAAEAYCVALHRCDTAALAALFAPAAHLYAAEAGGIGDLPRDVWLERVAAREKPDAATPPSSPWRWSMPPDRRRRWPACWCGSGRAGSGTT